MTRFLLWRWPEGAAERLCTDRVATRLRRIFSPLFSVEPQLTVRECGDSTAIAVLDLPVAGWRKPFFEESRDGWAQAVDFPLNIDEILSRNSIENRESSLLALGRLLEASDDSVLNELAPPFSLIWSSPNESEMIVQNDGLGQAQLYEYEDARVFAVSNGIMAFRALDLRLTPDPEQWAARAALGWFPLCMTGYKEVRHLPAGTQLRIGPSAICRSTTDVLASWLNPPDREADDWLEIARCSLLKLLRSTEPHWDLPYAGLTGGWDSRASVSSLRAIGARFRARVKGHPASPDVIIATELARLADIDIEVTADAELPGDTADDCRHSIRLALLWQAGHADTEKHKTAFARGRLLSGGQINLMGQHGELGRGSLYAESIRSARAQGAPVNGGLIARSFPDALFARRPVFLRPDLLDFVRDAIQTAWNAANRYGLQELARLDFYYLTECTRRRSGGSLSGQPGLVIAPFLNADFIRACFARVPLEKVNSLFHRHIVARNAPDWADVRYASKRASTNPAMLYYDLSEYWKTTGAPVIAEAIAADGFWTEVFDAPKTRKHPYAAPDDLTMLHFLPGTLSMAGNLAARSG